MLITNVLPAALLAGVGDVVGNAASTASVVTGGAPGIVAPPPAGTDEASALATVNTSVHAANFLATAAQSVMEMGHYAGQLGNCGFVYETIDDANAAALL